MKHNLLSIHMCMIASETPTPRRKGIDNIR